MATRQNSSNGKPKSPRIQVVLPEDLCAKLAVLAEQESRTVSNMAKVLIQDGVNKFEEKMPLRSENKSISSTEKFRIELESQKEQRLKGAPRRLRIFKPKSI